MKILVIEDERELQQVITESLQQEQYLTETAGDHFTAMDKVIAHEYDCILLDIMLPGGNGLDILKELRKLGKSDRVIIISAKDSLDDKITGLNLGADDYLTKPFHLAELHARIKSVLRRRMAEGLNTLTLHNVEILPIDRMVFVDTHPFPLNRKEYDILLYLANNKNRLVNKTSLAEHVWGDHTDESDNYDFLYSQIKNLRKKLNQAGATIEIQAIYGIGYKLIV